MNILFRIFKYISIILITFSLFMGINFIDNNSYATNTKLYEVARIVDPTVNQNAYKVKKAYDNEKVNNAVGKILGTIRNIGIIISVIVLMINIITQTGQKKKKFLTILIFLKIR